MIDTPDLNSMVVVGLPGARPLIFPARKGEGLLILLATATCKQVRHGSFAACDLTAGQRFAELH